MADRKEVKTSEKTSKNERGNPDTNTKTTEANKTVADTKSALKKKDEEKKKFKTNIAVKSIHQKNKDENIRQETQSKEAGALVSEGNTSVDFGPANPPYTRSGDRPTGDSSANLDHDVNKLAKDTICRKKENEQELTEVRSRLIETLEENRALKDKAERQRQLIEDRAIEHKKEIEKLLEEKTNEHKNQIEKLLREQATEHKKEMDKLLELNVNLQTDIAKAHEEKAEECKMLKEKHERRLKDLEKKHDQEMEDKKSQLSEMKKERDDIKTRFSKLAGSKLTDQNADIADLSDPFRALKLSEKFGALYDDEWTDAFLLLKKKMPTKDAIILLIRMLQDCLGYCAALSDSQMNGLKNVLLHPSQDASMYAPDPIKQIKRTKQEARIGSKDEGAVFEVRRKIGITDCVLSEVIQGFIQETKSWDKTGYVKQQLEKCTPYLKKCAEVCWLMTIHCPPLYIKLDVQQGDNLDLNYFSNYKTLSDKIDYLVWPPLFNEKNGGLLKKGVAEGIENAKGK